MGSYDKSRSAFITSNIINIPPLSDTRQDGDDNHNGGSDYDRIRQHKGRMWYRLDTATKKTKLKIYVTMSVLCVLLILTIAILNKSNSYKWNAWSPWQACSLSCGPGTGVEVRTRSCNTTEVECKGPDRESQICSASVRCPIWNGWNPWGGLFSFLWLWGCSTQNQIV